MTKIIEVEGIGPKYGAKLLDAAITTQEKLLEKGGDKKGRKQIAEQTGISEKLVLEWVNQADLARIKGVGSEYADLLEASGVDTVPELAQRNAQNLYAKLKEVNDEKKLVRALPSESDVDYWIKQAKELPRAVHY
jgi:predicted flap endonuclease-1-like 5' DNA nuclease